MNHPFRSSALTAVIRRENDRYYNRRKCKLKPMDDALNGIHVLLLACTRRSVLHVATCGLQSRRYKLEAHSSDVGWGVSPFTGGISIDVKRSEGLGLCFRHGDEMGGPPQNFPSSAWSTPRFGLRRAGTVACRNGYGPAGTTRGRPCAGQHTIRPRPPRDQASISGSGHRISGGSTVRSLRLYSIGGPDEGDPPPQVGKGVRLRDRSRVAIGDPDVKDLARANQVVSSSQNFFDRRDRVLHADRMGVDGIGAQLMHAAAGKIFFGAHCFRLPAR
jgi:hypothetical protein